MAATDRHILTVALEDYFQTAPVHRMVPFGHWHRFERRIEQNTRRTLDLLDEYGQTATFFVIGWIADQMPEVLQEVVRRGHEIASKGYFHRSLHQMDRAEFLDDAIRSREALERAVGRAVLGYRIAHDWFGPADLWALPVLARAGYLYDSSVRPQFGQFAGRPEFRVAGSHRFAPDSLPQTGPDDTAPHREFHEFPLSAWHRAGWSLPISGGNYHRQFPEALMRRAVADWQRRHDAPFLMYFHIWDLDPEQPRISSLTLRQRIRQYRNLDKMPAVLRHYLQCYRFGSAADWLGVSPVPVTLPPRPAAAPAAVVMTGAAGTPVRPVIPATVVVPCYNEEATLPYLANTLKQFQQALAGDYAFEFVFVDDGSRDATWQRLNELFDQRTDCTLVRHGRNRGITGAILSGIEAARTEIVCTIDCDCTYDPMQLKTLLPMLEEGVDLVTASPYHPLGGVRNVPPWRLFLSRGLSRLYRLVLRQKLHTYTSCFRVYRRSAVAGVAVQETGFLGMAEILAQLDLRGARIAEVPAVLEVRLLGRSKMKIARTIFGHLKLLMRIAWARWRPRSRVAAAGLSAAVLTSSAISSPVANTKKGLLDA